MRPRKVALCVESASEELGALTMLLETRGHFSVVACATGVEALRVIERGRRVDIVVANLDLADMDGNELCRRARLRMWDPRLLLFARRAAAFSAAQHADRFLQGKQMTATALLEACRVVAARKRGPRKAPELVGMQEIAE